MKPCHLWQHGWTLGHYAKWNKWDRERQILYVITYTGNPKIKTKECNKMIQNIKKDSYVFCLDLKGKQFSSEEFSHKLDDIALNENSHITFILWNVIFRFLISYIETILKIILPLFYYFLDSYMWLLKLNFIYIIISILFFSYYIFYIRFSFPIA